MEPSGRLRIYMYKNGFEIILTVMVDMPLNETKRNLSLVANYY